MYAIGIDFGTESGRVLIVDTQSGAIVANHVTKYPHGVIERTFLDGSPLPEHWALQHPNDYLEVLRKSIPSAIKDAGISVENVVGIGLDFTACTVLPVREDGTPLCCLPEWNRNPHAYVKLWKHHAAQKYAEEINHTARLRGGTFLGRYGGAISSEWMLPKVLQTLREAPEIYEDAIRFVEAGDWVVWQLTSQETRNACTAGYKACWDRENGYPTPDFLKALDPAMEDLIGSKIPEAVMDVGNRAGGLTVEWSEQLGLLPDTPVAVAIIDAHASVPAVGVDEPGQMVITVGTSFCHLLLGEEQKSIPGIAGAVVDGIIPGYVGYEAGQAAGGDMFAWFVRNFIGKQQGQSHSEELLYKRLTEGAAQIPPGGTGLVVLDWMNGNRSVLMDADLTGVIVGLTLSTKEEEVYRALLEAAAFGTRVIIETFEKNGLSVKEIHACGGVAVKNTLLMQILADITGKRIYVNTVEHAPAVGAAILATVAAGIEHGGYASIKDATHHMASNSRRVYEPNLDARRTYDVVYREYCRLHEWFGRGNDVMKTLKFTRSEAFR